jgi:hypothetical membrane protein
MSFSFFGLLGLGGTSVVTIAIFFSALIYRGKQGEKFSMFNHFISELGEVGVSQGAWAFNLGLIIGGLCLLPSVIWLGFLFDSAFGWLGMATGIIAALGVSAVGLFPVNALKSHGRAAMTFFRGGLAMLVFFGLAILVQPWDQEVLPKTMNIITLLAVFIYAIFLVILTIRVKQKRLADMPLNPEDLPARPRFRLLPTLEWAVFFATIAWLFAVAFLI